MDNPQKTLPGFESEFESLDDITIDLSSFSNLEFATQSSGLTITAAASSPYLFTGASGSPTFSIGQSQGAVGFPSGVIATNAGTGPSINFNDYSINGIRPSSTLSITGDDADIDINGVSLMQTLRGIQERLNILTPDPGMEQEWDELRELREAYDKKLEQCREKSRMWKTLQSMPPPPKL